MRCKKYIKVTEKNIANTYGKIKKWIDRLNHNRYWELTDTTPTPINVVIIKKDICDKYHPIIPLRDRVISLIRLDAEFAKTKFMINGIGEDVTLDKSFNIHPSDKIYINNKFNITIENDYYIIGIHAIKKMHKFFPMASDFDGDLLPINSNKSHILINGKLDAYEDLKNELPEINFHGGSFIHDIKHVDDIDRSSMYDANIISMELFPKNK